MYRKSGFLLQRPGTNLSYYTGLRSSIKKNIPSYSSSRFYSQQYDDDDDMIPMARPSKKYNRYSDYDLSNISTRNSTNNSSVLDLLSTGKPKTHVKSPFKSILPPSSVPYRQSLSSSTKQSVSNVSDVSNTVSDSQPSPGVGRLSSTSFRFKGISNTTSNTASNTTSNTTSNTMYQSMYESIDQHSHHQKIPDEMNESKMLSKNNYDSDMYITNDDYIYDHIYDNTNETSVRMKEDTLRLDVDSTPSSSSGSKPIFTRASRLSSDHIIKLRQPSVSTNGSTHSNGQTYISRDLDLDSKYKQDITDVTDDIPSLPYSRQSYQSSRSATYTHSTHPSRMRSSDSDFNKKQKSKNSNEHIPDYSKYDFSSLNMKVDFIDSKGNINVKASDGGSIENDMPLSYDNHSYNDISISEFDSEYNDIDSSHTHIDTQYNLDSHSYHSDYSSGSMNANDFSRDVGYKSLNALYCDAMNRINDTFQAAFDNNDLELMLELIETSSSHNEVLEELEKLQLNEVYVDASSMLSQSLSPVLHPKPYLNGSETYSVYTNFLLDSVLHNNEDAVELLVRSGALAAGKPHAQADVLNYSILCLDKPLKQFVINEASDVNVVGSIGYSPILVAAAAGDVDTVDLLLTKSPNLDYVSWDGFGALFLATLLRPIEIIEKFVELGLDVNGLPMTPLNGDINADGTIGEYNGPSTFNSPHTSTDAEIQTIDHLDRWINVCNISTRTQAHPPVFAAILRDNVDVVRWYSEHPQFDVNHRDIYGNTPVDLALLMNNPEIIDLLVSKGGKKNNFTNDPKQLKLKADLIQKALAKRTSRWFHMKEMLEYEKYKPSGNYERSISRALKYGSFNKHGAFTPFPTFHRVDPKKCQNVFKNLGTLDVHMLLAKTVFCMNHFRHYANLYQTADRVEGLANSQLISLLSASKASPVPFYDRDLSTAYEDVLKGKSNEEEFNHSFITGIDKDRETREEIKKKNQEFFEQLDSVRKLKNIPTYGYSFEDNLIDESDKFAFSPKDPFKGFGAFKK